MDTYAGSCRGSMFSSPRLRCPGAAWRCPQLRRRRAPPPPAVFAGCGRAAAPPAPRLSATADRTRTHVHELVVDRQRTLSPLTPPRPAFDEPPKKGYTSTTRTLPSPPRVACGWRLLGLFTVLIAALSRDVHCAIPGVGVEQWGQLSQGEPVTLSVQTASRGVYPSGPRRRRRRTERRADHLGPPWGRRGRAGLAAEGEMGRHRDAAPHWPAMSPARGVGAGGRTGEWGHSCAKARDRAGCHSRNRPVDATRAGRRPRRS